MSIFSAGYEKRSFVKYVIYKARPTTIAETI